ncbi:hypothetical protein OQA88_12240 [Cercophora sp. LCS_1]
MATVPSGRAVYKKKDGIITLTNDQRALTWTPLPGTGPPHVQLSVDSIKNIQQTPATSAKVILRIIENPRAPDAEAPSYQFQFTSPTDARTEANAIRDVLSNLISGVRGNDPGVPKLLGPDQAGANGSGASAAMSFAQAANAKLSAARFFDDETLKTDFDLQQTLMDKDENLKQTYADALANKPVSISESSFNTQFWATRVNLLRAHAIERSQTKGLYNVLAVVKPKTVNDEQKLNLSGDNIRAIFQQHPIVKRIYNELVPKLDESTFWSQFFVSRLYYKLRGERPTEGADNPLFDRYIDLDATSGWTSRVTPQQIPHIIDVEANEEGKGGFKGGNRQDAEMRPRSNVPIVKTLNSLSDKIMVNVSSADQDLASAAAAAAGRDLDDSTFNQLSLQDLREQNEVKRFILNVKEQTEFFSSRSAAQSKDAEILNKQNPSDVLFEIQADLETYDDDGSGGIDLHKGIGVDDESDSDGGGSAKPPRVGSRASRKAAQDQILEGMAKKRATTYTGNGNGDDEVSPMGIPPKIAQRCYLTNATTTEFVKQFWTVFLSGDAARVQELAYWAESLQRCLSRINALADEAELERLALTELKKKEIREIYRKTNKKTKWVPIGGGKDAVLALFDSTITSIKTAQSLYKSAASGGH